MLLCRRRQPQHQPAAVVVAVEVRVEAVVAELLPPAPQHLRQEGLHRQQELLPRVVEVVVAEEEAVVELLPHRRQRRRFHSWTFV